ncbi:MAG: hypothetical protein Ta2F_08380 [Termitinemataceae bacterium]|nr:MAG: hypothetical protein Ta2F_08380 [Termitinemataceae bacterium]
MQDNLFFFESTESERQKSATKPQGRKKKSTKAAQPVIEKNSGFSDCDQLFQICQSIDLFLTDSDKKNTSKKNHTPDEYKKFVSSIYSGYLKIDEQDPVWKLLKYLEEKTDFFYAPASTQYHGSVQCGLVKHSLFVLYWCLKLGSVMLPAVPNYTHLATASLFHDLCKVNMYEEKTRNVKDEKTGRWEAVPCYRVREDYTVLGHGIESLSRLNEFVKLPTCWQYAVRFHMGAYDCSPSDLISLNKATRKYSEVLLLHTADMQASLLEDCA